MENHEQATPPHLSFLDKLRLLAGCMVAIVLMYTVGWLVAEPVDAQLAVTFVESGRPILSIWPGVLALTLVSASIATVIAGRRLPEAGAFAAGVGLTALALRGNSMQMVLAYCGSANAPGRRTLMWSMAWDCLLWSAIMTCVWVVMAGVRAWLWPKSPVEADGQAHGLRATDPPSWPAWAKGGWPALAITWVVACLVIWLTVARTPVANTLRGQVIASVGGGLFLGAMIGRYFTSIHDARWYALAAPAVALTAYLLGFLNAGMAWAQGPPYQPYAALAITPPHDLVRALPIEYIGAGVAAALLGFWSGEKIQHVVVEEAG